MSQIHMQAEDVIASIVDAMLPRFSPVDKVLVMSLHVVVCPRDSAIIKAWRSVHFMFHRPGNYMRVALNVSRKRDRYLDYTVWRLTADHDSSWKNEGVAMPLFDLGEELMQMYVNREVTADFKGVGPQLVTVKNIAIGGALGAKDRTMTVEYQTMTGVLGK